MTKSTLTLNRPDDLAQLKAAESVAETLLATERQALALAEAELPGTAAASVLSGQETEFERAQATVSTRQTAVRNAELVLQGIREKRQRCQANAEAADLIRRWREIERLLAVEADEGMVKMQTGLDLLAAGWRQLRTSTNKARMLVPGRPSWWPTLWESGLEGSLRRYLVPRGGPFNTNILSSQFEEILAGPDLVALHRKATNEILGSAPTDKKEAA